MMVSRHALAAFLLNGAAVHARLRAVASTPTTTMFWTATERIVKSTSMSVETYMEDTYTYEYNKIMTIKNDVTPTVSPTSTYVEYYTYSDLVAVTEYYPPDAVAASDLTSSSYDYATTATRTSTSIDFSMPVVMTAPTSCPTVFTVSTTVSVQVPSQVWSQITPASKLPASTTTQIYADYIYAYETWLLSESAAPFTSTDDSIYRFYIAQCTPPPASYTSGSRNTDSDSTSRPSWRDYELCYFGGSGCATARSWIIIIATVLPGLFLLGFLESYLWFRRLMMGRSAMRLGTVCWCLLSLWVMCFTRMQSARSAQDQTVLREMWQGVSTSQALRLWLRWGFRRRYPVPLLGQYASYSVGVVPEGMPLPPPVQMQQVGAASGAAPGCYPQQPPSHTEFYATKMPQVVAQPQPAYQPGQGQGAPQSQSQSQSQPPAA